MKAWSKSWKSSSKSRKQRKYRANAPTHVAAKMVSSHLSKELREKHGKRAMVVRKGDKVKVLRGKHRAHTGRVDDVDLKKGKIIVQGIDLQKKEGSKIPVLIDPSNVVITDLNLEDKNRNKILERVKK